MRIYNKGPFYTVMAIVFVALVVVVMLVLGNGSWELTLNGQG